MDAASPPFLRALRLPFQLASLLLVALAAVLLTMFGAFRPQVSVPAWLGTYVVCIWVNRYAFALLDAAANGESDAPVASVEMLGPFSDARSWVLPAFASLCALGIVLLPSSLRTMGLAAAIVLLPLPVAATELSDRLTDAVNPLAWWRALRGVGVLYPLLVCGVAVAAGLAWLLWHSPVWRVLLFAFTGLLYLACFALLGGALFMRRASLQFSPRRSPERTQERIDTDRARALQQMIDESYKSVRARRTQDLARTLDQWFAHEPATVHRADAAALVAASGRWSDPAGQRLLQRVLIERLGVVNPSLALQLAEEALRAQPDFTPQGEVVIALVRHARQTGRRRLGEALLANALRTASPPDRPALEALRDGPSP